MTMMRSGLPGTDSVMVTLAPLLSRISLTFLPCLPMMMLASCVTINARIWIDDAAAAAAAASAFAVSGLAGRSGFAAATVADTEPDEAGSTFIGAEPSAVVVVPSALLFSSVCIEVPFSTSGSVVSVLGAVESSSSTSSLSGAAVAWFAFFDDESAEGDDERERLRAMSALVGARESAMVYELDQARALGQAPTWILQRRRREARRLDGGLTRRTRRR